MAVGLHSQFDVSYLHERVAYRAGVAAADVGGPDSPSVPHLRLDVKPQSGVRRDDGSGVEYQRAEHGYNAHLELFINYDPGVVQASDIIVGAQAADDDRKSADIEVWAWGGAVERPATAADLVGAWCLVHKQTVVCPTLIQLKQVPATIYKVVVSRMEGGDALDIVAQHTV